MEEFHIRLREVRIKRGKTLKQTAEALDMKLRSYQYYEQGRSEPPIKKILALADYFDVTTDYLLGRVDE